MTIDVCFSPLLYTAYHDPEQIVVVTDIFRATTSIVTAFGNGAKSIIPVATVDEARAYKENGWLVGAERNVKRCDFADFGNSPFDYTADAVAGKDIVFTTTNGTKAIAAARHAFRLVVGAFINLEEVAACCMNYRRNVLILASAWEDKVNVEDTLFGGALTAELVKHSFHPATDAARIALELWEAHRDNLRQYIEKTDHYARLLANGLEDAVPYCLTLNTVGVVPELSMDGLRLARWGGR
ncbi:MAG: 2-phosphosulfolactate phosphatase [Tannerellaceae bacterium]|nr:2-phosphosulfolactate phosphatase [Tannerellaceae bacterium]